DIGRFLSGEKRLVEWDHVAGFLPDMENINTLLKAIACFLVQPAGGGIGFLGYDLYVAEALLQGVPFGGLQELYGDALPARCRIYGHKADVHPARLYSQCDHSVGDARCVLMDVYLLRDGPCDGVFHPGAV